MSAPFEIKRLAETVINKIAAGEVIQRPANALKEMIENCLDAKATNIQISVKNGGLKLLQIQDNGTGIRREDFPIVCERFTTSKLREFDDLQRIATYGFRGEALASISHVAHLSITSKTCNDVCAYKASFSDGKLVGPAVPTAGNQGTIITVEDLFFNMNSRRQSLRSPAEEYQKIFEVVAKYAIHNCNVGFALKKSKENNDLRTSPESSHVENIRAIYGNTIARELVEFGVENAQLKFKAGGHVTNVNYSTKKFVLLLFINHRLVDCQSLKKNLVQVYSTYLPKNGHPFVYLHLDLDPSTVDVNVHPTKHEVHFLNEDAIVAAICNSLEAQLLATNNSRVYYTQSKLPTFEPESLPLRDLDKGDRKIEQKNFVRTDESEQKLEKFFGNTQKDKSLLIAHRSKTEEDCFKMPQSAQQKKQKFDENFLPASLVAKVTRVETELTSVLALRKTIEMDCHKSLRTLFSQHVFVGALDPTKALLQYSTKLFLCDTQKIMSEFFYQLILYNFGNFDAATFSHHLCVRELALRGLDQVEVGWTAQDGPKEELADKVAEILTEHREMLNAYFAMEIDEDGRLKSLPVLLENYVPDIAGLPVFMVRLATEVNWHKEKDCFDTFAKEVARYFAEIDESYEKDGNDWKWTTEHVIYAAVKEYFLPPKKFTENGAILEIANLPNLYKVFERC